MSLSHEDVQRLLQLLDTSKFDELHLESDGTKLSLRRNGAGATASAQNAVAASPATPNGAAAAVPVVAPAVPVSSAGVPAAAGLIDIRASMLGTFYGAPKPGAPRFVEIGAKVQRDTVIGIIEVMKLMNSISATVDGEIVEVLARDGELVEFDEVLMRVRPTAGNSR